MGEKKIEKVELNYMPGVSQTEPVAIIPVDAADMEKLDRCIIEKCKQNQKLSMYVPEYDKLYYASSPKKQGVEKKLTK